MNFNDLRAFIAVAEELNFRKAAESLAMSQPPLTRLIAKLEDELGTSLFARTTRRVEITAAGVALLKEAREILAKVSEAERIVRQVGRLKRGELNLSFTTMAYYSPLPNLVIRFREFFPDVAIDLKARTYAKSWSDLNSGKADVIFCEGPLKEEGFQSLPLSSNELGVYLPLKHPLSKRKKIRVDELVRPRFIFHPRSEAPHFHDSIRAFLDDHSLDYDVRVRKQGESCQYLVAMDQGLLLASRNSCATVTEGIRFVPLEKPAPAIRMFAVWRESEKPEVLSFVSFLKELNSLNEPCPNCFMGLSSQ